MESSAVSFIGYDEQTKILFITYKGGHPYRYFGVPEREYANLKAADSIGEYINKHIKGNYNFEKLEDYEKYQ